MAETLYEQIHDGLVQAKEVYRAEAHRLGDELAYLRTLAENAVREYPVASGLYVDSDGQAGYGSLKALRLFLGIAPDRGNVAQSSAYDTPKGE